MKSMTMTLMEILIPRTARAKFLLVAAVIFLATTVVWGQSASEPSGDFGLLGQLSTSVTVANPVNVAPVACAPTSTANGLTFLDTFYGPSIFTSDP
jgi:hypothetical protein